MRSFILARHPSSKSIYESADSISDRPPLDLVRSVGHWAFVSVPDDDDLPCIIHYWHRKTLDPVLVARMLAHEVGHISDGGPKTWLGGDEEEDRADEFAKVTAEVVNFLIKEGVLFAQPRGSNSRVSRRAARPRRQASFGPNGR